MSRLIKFRAWVDDVQTMYFSQEVIENSNIIFEILDSKIRVRFHNDCEEPEGYSEFENYHVMQYTGINDKNGVEIYEGDILRFPAKDKWSEENYSAFEVFYHDNDCADSHIGFQMNRVHSFGSVAGGNIPGFLPKITSKMIVIGNIHENPELLEN